MITAVNLMKNFRLINFVISEETLSRAKMAGKAKQISNLGWTGFTGSWYAMFESGFSLH
jgi:hypothetical protein